MLEIKIIGNVGEGKTTLALLIRKALEEHGMKVSVNDEEANPYGLRIPPPFPDKVLQSREVLIGTYQRPRVAPQDLGH